MTRSSIVIHRGADAWSLLADDRVRRWWRELYDACPWATGYQSLEFAETWYESYRSRYTPVIVAQTENDTGLGGLLCLAASLDARELVVVGAHQAEYHAWLARPTDGGTFAAAALRAVVDAFSGRRLEFRYVPAGVGAAELHALCAAVPRTEMKARQRPLMRIDREELEQSFKKKSNKSRFNRVKALGQFEFKRITSPDALDALFDDIIDQYDFRQAAAHSGVLPFLGDPLKKPFHRAMLACSPDLLHVTVSTIDGRPIAAHFGVAGKGQVHLAIIAYSPFMARHSPAKLHLMQLGRLLGEEGFDLLDLTPGDDPWKERFANAHDQVHELTIYGSQAEQTLQHLRARAGTVARDAAARAGLTPDAVRALAGRLRRVNPVRVAGRVRRLVSDRVELRIYRRDAHAPLPLAPDGRMTRDSVEDLLKFEPSEGRQTKSEYLSSALERLEAGVHSYTHVFDGRLLHSGWLADQQESSLFTEVDDRFEYPAGSAVLYDFYTDPSARGRGLYQSAIAQMLADVAALPGAQYAYIVVEATNAASRHVIEKLGFAYQASMFKTTSLGQVQRWSDPPQAPRTESDAAAVPSTEE